MDMDECVVVGRAARGERAGNDMAAELVASIPGSIAFVDSVQIPKNVKVVKTNGLLPGERGYPLR